jgi:hypothetical protein
MILTDEGQIFGCGLALNGRLGLEAPTSSTPPIIEEQKSPRSPRSPRHKKPKLVAPK